PVADRNSPAGLKPGASNNRSLLTLARTLDASEREPLHARDPFVECPARQCRRGPLKSRTKERDELLPACGRRVVFPSLHRVAGFVSVKQPEPLCYFLRDYLGNPIPSRALFKPMHDRFVTAVEEFVARHAIPVVHFEPGQDKDAIATTHRAHFTAREGVVMNRRHQVAVQWPSRSAERVGTTNHVSVTPSAGATI